MAIKVDSILGNCGFISWDRLAELMKQSGELTKSESHISEFEVGDRGLTFKIEYKEAK